MSTEMEKYDNPTFQLRIQSIWLQGMPIKYKSRNGEFSPVDWTPLPDFELNLDWSNYIYYPQDCSCQPMPFPKSVATPKEATKEEQTHMKNAFSLTEVILSERQKTHGDFRDHARITYRLKQVLRDEAEIMGKQLSPVQSEALEMVCHKIGRIFAGNPDFIDHWDDIVGYATLVAKDLRQAGE